VPARAAGVPSETGERMSAPLIIGVGVVYLVVAVDQLRHGHPGMAIAWLGYALANVGLAWQAWR